MPANDEIPAKTLANLKVSIGQLMTALGPLALVVWQGVAWAQEIEDNIKANQRAIAELIEQVRVNDASDKETREEIVDAIDRLADRYPTEPGSSSAEPVD